MKTSFFQDKVILVSGAAGSIGRELVFQLLDLGAKAVRALDNNETGLFHLEQKLSSDRLRVFIGDIRDYKRLNLALENVDIVFHAAALKHVPLCEKNPFEAAKTNIIGTQNLIDAALAHNVNKFITISTDKAINPTNVMGATKLVAERLTIAANLFKGLKDISFSTVRFGNVLGSRGSVMPVTIKQIQNKKPVTITDPNMTRFIMSIKEAVELVIEAASLAKGGEIFILEMHSVNMGIFIETVIEVAASIFNYSVEEIETKIIGRREGEKNFEELLSSYESINYFIFKKEKLYILIPKEPYYHPEVLTDYYSKLGAKVENSHQICLNSSSEDLQLNSIQLKPLIQDFVIKFSNYQSYYD